MAFFNVDFPSGKTWILFLSGMAIGMFAPSVLTDLKNMVFGIGQEQIETRSDFFIDTAKDSLAGTVLTGILAGGLVYIAQSAVMFIYGIIVGYCLRIVFWYHLGWIPEPSFGALGSWMGL